MKKDPLLWTLYYSMLEANHIYGDGYGFYPAFWKCAKAAVEVYAKMPANGEIQQRKEER